MAEQIFCARLHATGLLDATGFGRRSGEQLGLLQRPLLQRRFGQHHVDAFVQIDKLRDVHVGGDAAERISVGGGKAGRAFDQYDHLAQVRCGRDISRSGSNAIVMTWVGVSAQGRAMPVFLASVRSVPASLVSIGRPPETRTTYVFAPQRFSDRRPVSAAARQKRDLFVGRWVARRRRMRIQAQRLVLER
jgi:hypothetical protein